MHTSVAARQRQIRGFVVAWLGITLLMGAVTFIGIYYATGLVGDQNNGSSDDVSVAALSNAEADDLEQAARRNGGPGPDRHDPGPDRWR